MWWSKKKQEDNRQELEIQAPEVIEVPLAEVPAEEVPAVVETLAVEPPTPVVDTPKKRVKTGRRLEPKDIEAFKLGTLQQAVQVYQYLIAKGFTFYDLVEYVEYATKFQAQISESVMQTPTIKAAPAETTQVRPLTRQEKKRFKGAGRRRR